MKNNKTASLSLRKLLLTAVVAAPLATLPAPLWALPASQTALNTLVTPSTGVTVTLTNANRIDVSSTANISVVKWTELGAGTNLVGATDVINFALPSSSSSVLNMVTGASASTIDGTLSSNGNLYLMNPNGIIVGATGVITGSSVGLSTVPETEFNFLNTGTLSYTPNQTSSSTTTGDITVTPGATITALSSSGNIWLTGQDLNVGGTLIGGNVSATTQNNGNIVLAAGGNLVVGNPATGTATFTATAVGTGTITIGDGSNGSATIWGPTATLRTGNTAISMAGTGSLIVGAGGTGNSTLTVDAGTGAITLPRVVNNNANTLTANVRGAAVTVSAPTGRLTVLGNATSLTTTTGAGQLSLGNLVVTGAVNATAVGGDLTSSGNVTAGGLVTLRADDTRHITFFGNASAGGFNIASNSGTLGNVTLNSNTDLVLPTIAGSNNVIATAAGNITTSGAITANTGSGNNNQNTVITSNGGTVTLGHAITTTRLNVTATSDILVSAAQSVVAAGNTTFTSTSGNVTLNAALGGTTGLHTLSGRDVTLGAAQTAGNITVTATGNTTVGGALTIANHFTVTSTGNVTQTAAITSGGNTTITGNNTITLNGANNFTRLSLRNAPNGAAVSDINGFTLGLSTNVTGNLTLTGSTTTAGTITLGNSSTDTVTVRGNLVVDNDATANGLITDGTNNITVLGNATFLVGGTGTVTIDGAASPAGTGVGLNHQFGQIAITTANANATIYEKTTLNLGAVNLGTGTLTAYSTTGIINTGRLQITNAVVGAGTSANPGNISLTYTDATTPNSILGTITVLDDFELSSPGFATVGNYLARNLSVSAGTVTGGATALVSVPENVFGAGLLGNISITTTGAANLVAGALAASGTVNLTSDTGSITATNAGNAFSSVNVTTANTTGASAVSSADDYTVNGTVGGTQDVAYTGAGNITIGSYTSTSTGVTTFGGATTQNVVDSVNGISIANNVALQANNIAITRSGHNFGQVSITTNSNGNATVVESGTLRLGTAALGTGALTATSQNGSVIQTAATTITAGNATFSASRGSVVLDNAANAYTGNVSVTALGNSSLTTNAAIAIGNTTTSGTFAVTSTGGAITQQGNATINAFGATSFTTTNAAITANNSGNRFGALTLSSGTGAITVKELTTVNLRSVATSGALTVTSESGSIVDSGTVTATGTTTLSAAGAITLGNTTSNYVTLASTAGGNITIVDGVGDTVLGNTTAGGSLSVTNTAGNIGQSGPIIVSGDTTLSATAATSTIILNNPANQFGALRFTVGTGGATINEATTLNLRAGSTAAGAVTLTTAGNFITSGTGASTFSNGLTINATGTITPGAGSLVVLNGLTVNSPAAKNLSGLSLSGNLFNVAPTNQGAGTYTAPAP